MPSNLQGRLDGVKHAAAERTFRRYGLDDLFREHDIAPAGPGVYNKLVTVGKHMGEIGRDMFLGSPITMAQRLQRNYRQTGSAPKALGKYIKDWYLDPNTPLWMRAVSVGLPVAMLGSTLIQDPPEKRKEDLAAGLLGIAASPLTARLGSAGADMQAGIQNAALRGIHALEPSKDDLKLVAPSRAAAPGVLTPQFNR